MKRIIKNRVLIVLLLSILLGGCESETISINDLNLDKITMRVYKSYYKDENYHYGIKFIGHFDEYNISKDNIILEISINYPNALKDMLHLSIKSKEKVPLNNSESEFEFKTYSMTFDFLKLEDILKIEDELNEIEIELYKNNELVDKQNIDLEIEYEY